MRKLVTLFVTIGGILEVFFALVLFILPFQIICQQRITDTCGISANQIILSSLSIGLCLLVFGILALHFVKRLLYLETTTIYFCLSQGILWLGILILEIIFPIRILVFKVNIYTLFIIGSVFIIALYMSVFSLFIYDKNH